MSDEPAPLDQLLDRIEALLEAVDAMPEADRDTVIELLDRVDDLHRTALTELAHTLPTEEIERLRDTHPAIAWLWAAYGVGTDPRQAVEDALESIRPYLHSHGGEVEVVDVQGGRVTVRLAGACVGCSASAITLQEGVDEALRGGFPGFRELIVDPSQDADATAHEPPGPTLLQIEWHPEATVDRAR